MSENRPVFPKLQDAELANSFEHAFGCALDSFYNPEIGFDLSEFARYTHYVDDGESAFKKYVTRMYGEEAAELIDRILAAEWSLL